MLAVVLGDRANLLRSIGIMVAGVAAAVVIGWVVGQFVVNDVVAATNSQVAGRVHPRLIDLVAALATGAVGSVALVRRDISDTLPGVAIAISLVPPLTVVGLTLESGAPAQAAGALVLFLTNVAAILVMGIIVMALYGVHRLVAPASADRRTVNRRNAVLVVIALLLVIVVPLAVTSASITRDTAREAQIRDVAREWATAGGWELTTVTTEHDGVVVRVEGQPPVPEADELTSMLEADGVDPDDIRVEYLPRSVVELDENG
jgi:uncharacterized hydrophobic protein (TIGR00271 family)